MTTFYFSLPGAGRVSRAGHNEHMEQAMKKRLSKYHQEELPWPHAPLLVLCSIRATASRKPGWSPFQIITGRPICLPGSTDLRKADNRLANDGLVENCAKRTHAALTLLSRYQLSAEGGDTLIPDEWALIKEPQKEQCEARLLSGTVNHRLSSPGAGEE